MELQLGMFLGEHNFTSFRSSGCNSKNPIKNISHVELKTLKILLLLLFQRMLFLQNMVRIMVGTILDIAKNEIDLTIKEILEKQDRQYAGKTAPAKGLFFLGPKYKDENNINSYLPNLFDRLKTLMKPLIKICGIAEKDNLIQLIKIEKINFLGFIFYEQSPRNATIDFINSISNLDFKNKRAVCVYVNADEEFIKETSSYFTNPILQFHGDETNTFCKSFKKRFLESHKS